MCGSRPLHQGYLTRAFHRNTRAASSHQSGSGLGPLSPTMRGTRRSASAVWQALPERAQDLADVERRLVDLLPIIRHHVYHPSFEGSFSLKRVLPALVPGLRYDAMDIAEGKAASKELAEVLLRKLRELALGY